MEKSRKKPSEQSKSKNPDGKSVKEGSRTALPVGSVGNSKQNGVRVSSNGEEDLVDDSLGGGVAAVVKNTKVVETENEVAGDGVGINDGISLLVDVSTEMGREGGGDFNQREDGGFLNEQRENPEEKIREMSQSEDEEEDDCGGGDYEFCVGDFVWGKIKSYPWWPGQIYDSSDASDYALKVKRRDRLLVAYFDGTFAWCHPYQLKPFEKNFEEMSKQSSSKSFVKAVRKALDEIGRLVELKMTCSCVPKESLIGLARPLAANSGIKPGVVIPEGGIAKLWNYLFGPSECLAELKYVARVISINNMLEFTELKCWLSTFYRVLGGYQLPLYHESQPIPGLEDNHRNQVFDLSNDAEGPIKGPVEEETNQFLLQKCLMDSENGQHKRRKQKSIAEIMEGYVDTSTKNVDEDVTKEGTVSGNPTPSSSRMKRKGNDEANGGTSLSSRPKRRKVTKILEATPATGTGIPGVVEMDRSKAKEKIRKILSLREQKKNKASHTKNDDGSKEKTNASSVSVERRTVQREDGEDKEQIEKRFLSRERKRSKYLSPPYTSINRRQSKKDLEVEFLKNSSEARVAERMTRPAANSIGSESPAIMMCSDEVLQKKDAKDVGSRPEKSDTSNSETMKLDQSTVIDTMKVKASAKDVLSGIRSIAINLYSLKKKDSLDVVEGFVSIYRSSIYCNGSNYKTYNKSQPSRKRKTRDSEPVSSAKGQNQTDQMSTEQRSRRTKIKKNEEAKMMKDDKRKSEEPVLQQAGDAKTKGRLTDGKEKSDKPKLKQARRPQDKKRKYNKTDGKAAPDINTNDKETDGKASPAALFVTFGPASSLPSKNDLIKIYHKFGSLNEEETEMFYNNYCAQVVFLRSSDAEEAFKSSHLANPFGDSNCNFELRNSPSTSKLRKLKERSNAKPSPAIEALEKRSGSKKSIGEASPLNYVKQKLKMVGSVLASSDGKISPELKSKLEGEVKDLLKKYNKKWKSTLFSSFCNTKKK